MTDETQGKQTKRPRETNNAADYVPIRLLKGYRPFGDDKKGWGDFLIERDGDLQEPGVNEEGTYDRDKVKAGTVIHVPREEARRALKHGIAERADEL